MHSLEIERNRCGCKNAQELLNNYQINLSTNKNKLGIDIPFIPQFIIISLVRNPVHMIYRLHGPGALQTASKGFSTASVFVTGPRKNSIALITSPKSCGTFVNRFLLINPCH